MKPQTAGALCLAALLAIAAQLPTSAQSVGASGPSDQNPPPGGPAAPSTPSSGEYADSNPFLPSDQTIGLVAGGHLPVFIVPKGSSSSVQKLYLGGAFSFQYQYFVARGLAVGGTISGAFNGTLGGRSLFVAPLSFRTAYWWSLLPFELCVAAEAGGYLMRLDTFGMMGPFAKAGGGAFWRLSPGWSLGVQTYFWLVPEIHTGSYSGLTRTSGFTEIALAAIYHL